MNKTIYIVDNTVSSNINQLTSFGNVDLIFNLTSRDCAPDMPPLYNLEITLEPNTDGDFIQTNVLYDVTSDGIDSLIEQLKKIRNFLVKVDR